MIINDNKHDNIDNINDTNGNIDNINDNKNE